MDTLTGYERRVLALAAKGLDDAEIGHRLGCTHAMVRRSLNTAYGKLGVQRQGVNPRVTAVLMYLSANRTVVKQ